MSLLSIGWLLTRPLIDILYVYYNKIDDYWDFLWVLRSHQLIGSVLFNPPSAYLIFILSVACLHIFSVVDLQYSCLTLFPTKFLAAFSKYYSLNYRPQVLVFWHFPAVNVMSRDPCSPRRDEGVLITSVICESCGVDFGLLTHREGPMASEVRPTWGLSWRALERFLKAFPALNYYTLPGVKRYFHHFN